MQKLLYTPDEIEAARIIPYCAEEIRRLVRRGEIPAVRRRGRRILIHYKDLECYADKFRLGHTEPVAGPHASRKGGKACREDNRKASTKGGTRRTGGHPTPMDGESALDALLGYR